MLFFQPFLIKTFELSSVFCLAFTLWPCIVHFVFQSLNNILIENININIHLPKSSVFCLTALFRVGSGVINVINYDTGYFRYCTDHTNDDNDGRDDHHLTVTLTISGGDYYGMKSCKYRYSNSIKYKNINLSPPPLVGQSLKENIFVPIPIAQSVPTLLLDFPHLGVHQHQHTSPHSGIIIRKSLRHQIIMPSQNHHLLWSVPSYRHHIKQDHQRWRYITVNHLMGI